MSAGALQPDRVVPEPRHRIDSCIAAFHVASARGPLSSPDRILTALRRDLLPELDRVLHSDRLAGASARVETLEIDLGDWPEDPNWSDLRAAFRERLESALTPYLTWERPIGDTAGAGAAQAGTAPQPPRAQHGTQGPERGPAPAGAPPCFDARARDPAASDPEAPGAPPPAVADRGAQDAAPPEARLDALIAGPAEALQRFVDDALTRDPDAAARLHAALLGDPARRAAFLAHQQSAIVARISERLRPAAPATPGAALPRDARLPAPLERLAAEFADPRSRAALAALADAIRADSVRADAHTERTAETTGRVERALRDLPDAVLARLNDLLDETGSWRADAGDRRDGAAAALAGSPPGGPEADRLGPRLADLLVSAGHSRPEARARALEIAARLAPRAGAARDVTSERARAEPDTLAAHMRIVQIAARREAASHDWLRADSDRSHRASGPAPEAATDAPGEPAAKDSAAAQDLASRLASGTISAEAFRRGWRENQVALAPAVAGLSAAALAGWIARLGPQDAPDLAEAVTRLRRDAGHPRAALALILRALLQGAPLDFDAARRAGDTADPEATERAAGPPPAPAVERDHRRAAQGRPGTSGTAVPAPDVADPDGDSWNRALAAVLVLGHEPATVARAFPGMTAPRAAPAPAPPLENAGQAARGSGDAQPTAAPGGCDSVRTAPAPRDFPDGAPGFARGTASDAPHSGPGAADRRNPALQTAPQTAPTHAGRTKPAQAGPEGPAEGPTRARARSGSAARADRPTPPRPAGTKAAGPEPTGRASPARTGTAGATAGSEASRRDAVPGTPPPASRPHATSPGGTPGDGGHDPGGAETRPGGTPKDPGPAALQNPGIAASGLELRKDPEPPVTAPRAGARPGGAPLPAPDSAAESGAAHRAAVPGEVTPAGAGHDDAGPSGTGARGSDSHVRAPDASGPAGTAPRGVSRTADARTEDTRSEDDALAQVRAFAPSEKPRPSRDATSAETADGDGATRAGSPATAPGRAGGTAARDPGAARGTDGGPPPPSGFERARAGSDAETPPGAAPDAAATRAAPASGATPPHGAADDRDSAGPPARGGPLAAADAERQDGDAPPSRAPADAAAALAALGPSLQAVIGASLDPRGRALRAALDLLWSALPHPSRPSADRAGPGGDGLRPRAGAPDPDGSGGPRGDGTGASKPPHPDPALDPRYWQLLLHLGAEPPRPDDSLAAFLDRALRQILPEPDARAAALRLAIARLGHAGGGISPALRVEVREALRRLPDAPAPAPADRDRAASPQTPAAQSRQRLLTGRAGLVLFHPFLTLLFQRLEVLETPARIAPDRLPRALAALQMIAEAVPASRPADPLEKLLLALPQDGRAPKADLSDPPDATLIDGLVRAMIERWGALGQTSPEGLREVFLRRAGTLQEVENGTRLRVDPGPYDMLLDRLPWGISTVALPWMDRPCHVSWRSGDD